MKEIRETLIIAKKLISDEANWLRNEPNSKDNPRKYCLATAIHTAAHTDEQKLFTYEETFDYVDLNIGIEYNQPVSTINFPPNYRRFYDPQSTHKTNLANIINFNNNSTHLNVITLLNLTIHELEKIEGDSAS